MELREFIAPKLKEIGSCAFASNSNMTGVDMPEVQIVGDSAFLNGTLLQTVSLPKATHIGKYAFGHCVQLKSVRLPAVTRIGTAAFWDCERLVELYLPATPPTVEPEAFKFASTKTFGVKPVIKVPKGAYEAYEQRMSDFPKFALEED